MIHTIKNNEHILRSTTVFQLLLILTTHSIFSVPSLTDVCSQDCVVGIGELCAGVTLGYLMVGDAR